MRRLYAHAFTDTALLEQAPLLTHYFNRLISKLKQKIDGHEHGRVDIMAFYNFTTFDIIGYIYILCIGLVVSLTNDAGISPWASRSGRWKAASTPHGSRTSWSQ